MFVDAWRRILCALAGYICVLWGRFKDKEDIEKIGFVILMGTPAYMYWHDLLAPMAFSLAALGWMDAVVPLLSLYNAIGAVSSKTVLGALWKTGVSVSLVVS